MKISEIGDNLVVGMFALAAGINFASMEEQGLLIPALNLGTAAIWAFTTKFHATNTANSKLRQEIREELRQEKAKKKAEEIAS